MSVNGRRILIVMSLPLTTTPLYAPLSLNGPLYLSPSRKNVVLYVGPSGSSSIAKDRLTAYAMSAGLTGVPSSYFKPLRSVNVHDLLSELGRPRSVAMSGISCMSLVLSLYAYWVRERVTRSDMIAVESVKYARVGSRVAGTWFVRTVSVPPFDASDGTASGPSALAFLNEPAPPPAARVLLLSDVLFPLPPPQAASVMSAAVAKATAGFFMRIEVYPPFLAC